MTPKNKSPEHSIATKSPASVTKGLTLDQLRTFSSFAHSRRGASAAKPLGSRARTVKRQARAVEQHFGAQLFANETFKLSAQGEKVLEVVDRALQEFDLVKEWLHDERTTLRIGYIRLMRPLVERAVLALNRQGGKRPRVRFVELTSDAQVHALNVRKIDVAVCFERDEFRGRASKRGSKREDTRRDIERTTLADQPYALVVPERAWQNGELSMSFLEGLDYVHPRQADVIEAGKRWFKRKKFRPSSSIESDLATEMITYAGSESGYGFLPAFWGVDSRERVAFVPVKRFTTAKISAYVMKPCSGVARRFIEQLRVEAQHALTSS